MPYHTMQPTRAQPARAPVPGYIDPPTWDRYRSPDIQMMNTVGGSGQMDPALIEQLMEVMRRSRMGGQRSPGAVQSQMMNTMGRGPAVESQMMNTMGRAPGNRPVARQIGGRPSGVDPAALMEMMRGTMGGNPLNQVRQRRVDTIEEERRGREAQAARYAPGTAATYNRDPRYGNVPGDITAQMLAMHQGNFGRGTMGGMRKPAPPPPTFRR
jgi:hypothetical protein